MPGETLRIYLRQELGNKLGILDDSQLERLMPKQAENGTVRPAPQLKRTTMRILIGLLVQNPELAPQVPSLAGLNHEKLPGLGLFSELVNTCLSQPGLTTGQLLEHYRGTKEAATLEKLSMWDDIADKDIAEKRSPTHSTICLIRCLSCARRVDSSRAHPWTEQRRTPGALDD